MSEVATDDKVTRKLSPSASAAPTAAGADAAGSTPASGGRAEDCQVAGARIQRFAMLHAEGERRSDGDADADSYEESGGAARVQRKIFRSGGSPPPAPGGARNPATNPEVVAAGAQVTQSAGQMLAKLNDFQIKIDILRSITVPPVDSLSAEVAMTAFITASESMLARWDALSTPEARITILTGAANMALSAVGVPHPAVNATDGLGSTFSASKWEIGIGKAPFTTKPPPERLQSTCTTVYHEARHAEQYWKIARMLAGDGKKPEEIASLSGVPANIASAAAGVKIPPTQAELQVSQKLLDALNDPPNIALLARLKVALHAYDNLSSPENKNEWFRAEIKPDYPAYLALAPEADAFGLEEKVQTLWTKLQAVKAPTA